MPAPQHLTATVHSSYERIGRNQLICSRKYGIPVVKFEVCDDFGSRSGCGLGIVSSPKDLKGCRRYSRGNLRSRRNGDAVAPDSRFELIISRFRYYVAVRRALLRQVGRIRRSRFAFLRKVADKLLAGHRDGNHDVYRR